MHETVNSPQNFILRITRWIDEEEDRIKASDQTSLQYVIMNMTGKFID